MPLGEFFSCVWLVLLAINFMTTFPRCTHCSSSPPSSADTRSSSSAAASTSALGSPESSGPASSSSSSSSSSIHPSAKQLQEQPPPNSAPAAAAISSAAGAETAQTFCHHPISTEDLSPDCLRIAYTHEEPRMRITGDVNEGPGPPSCLPSCAGAKSRRDSSSSSGSGSGAAGSASAASSKINSSCYRYLVPKDCQDAGPNDWASIRLRHCCEHSVHDAVPDVDAYLGDEKQCEQSVKHLLELDAFIAKVTCQFEQIIRRFDCQQNYSMSSCESCKVVYRRWVCAALIPHWRERHKIKPCRSTCHAVEQKCPWFLPADHAPGTAAQYAGEPIFQCIDPDISESGEQLKRSTYGSDCCYDYCEQKRSGRGDATTGGYHHTERSHQAVPMVVPCVRGCNKRLNDPSQNTKSEFPASCKFPASDSSTSSDDDDGSSCPLPDSSSPYSSSSTNNDGGAETSATTASGVLIVWLLCCLYFNARLNSWR